GADITITPHLVATGRFGYYFENYHDFGYPRNGTLFIWQNSGIGQTDSTGAPLPAVFQQNTNYANAAYSGTFTTQNANKAIQVDADLAWFKSGWKGTHNFKFGYQLNRLQNNILQSYNEPYVQMFPGPAGDYTPTSQLGINNCATASFPDGSGGCNGLY